MRREKSLEFHGEYGRLDIWMRNEDVNFVCAIENKVWASEGEGQLAWSRKVLAHDHDGQRVHRVYLTARGVPPDGPEEREHWMAMSYTDILRLVEGTVAAAGDAANEDVLALLRQYAITLRRDIVPEVSNDVHELARRIYRKHKRGFCCILRGSGLTAPLVSVTFPGVTLTKGAGICPSTICFASNAIRRLSGLGVPPNFAGGRAGNVGTASSRERRELKRTQMLICGRQGSSC